MEKIKMSKNFYFLFFIQTKAIHKAFKLKIRLLFGIHTKSNTLF